MIAPRHNSRLQATTHHLPLDACFHLNKIKLILRSCTAPIDLGTTNQHFSYEVWWSWSEYQGPGIPSSKFLSQITSGTFSYSVYLLHCLAGVLRIRLRNWQKVRILSHSTSFPSHVFYSRSWHWLRDASWAIALLHHLSALFLFFSWLEWFRLHSTY